MIISPTEPPSLRALGQVSMLPEQFGCDLLFSAQGGWGGVQRKEFKDLLASISDGRLGEQVLKMGDGLAYKMIVVEGLTSARWTLDGELVGNKWARVNRAALRKLLWSIRAAGVWVDWTDNVTDTGELALAFQDWCRKGTHKSLNVRAGVRSSWGTANNRDYQAHLLQGLPGVGGELADRILDTVGMPIGLKPGAEKQLLTVKGLGKKKLAGIMAALDETEGRG